MRANRALRLNRMPGVPGIPRSSSLPLSFSERNAREFRKQGVNAHGLGGIAVHAGLQAAFAVSLSWLRRHGDDGMWPAEDSLRRIAGVASKPSISGIWTSIRTRSKGRRCSMPQALRARCSARRRDARVSRGCRRRPAGSRDCLPPAESARSPAQLAARASRG